jgi:hypothetical protein
VDVEAGATPFIAYAGAVYSGGDIASVSYSILPRSGSVTRALGATFSANYLQSNNYFVPGATAVIIPVFGLYSGATNQVTITYSFTDGTKSSQTTSIKTATYTDPCASVAQRTYLGLRSSTASLTFDYFLLKDYCSVNSPAIIDTDGTIRWVGDGNDTAQDTAFFNNAFYFSDGKTGIKRIDITNGKVTQVADYASIGVTATNQHNADPGRDGLLVEVNTTSQLEATILEINPANGAVLKTWDMGAIISAAMTAGGDNPASFVLGTSAYWFHNNASVYNPADNTLVVSSRENFVIAVDYDAPSSGQRKIHWILGDPNKAWHGFPSLAKLALTPANASTLPPIGQHAVSIDHQGNVLVFDDGLGSLTYTASNNGQNLFSPICGSVYDVNGNYLVDFTTANAAAVTAAQAGQTPGAIVGTLETGSGTASVLVGVGGSNAIEFVSALQTPTPCSGGWNALPFASNVFTFK